MRRNGGHAQSRSLALLGQWGSNSIFSLSGPCKFHGPCIQFVAILGWIIRTKHVPKIVDHEAHSQDLAQRAAKYFSDFGYAGTSMRKVADYLGLSKSALYHYFPTKEDLFLACTKQVMATFDADLVDPKLSEEENLRRLTDFLRRDFVTEMALTFDYLRGKSQAEIAEDETMQVVVHAYLKVVTNIVGETRAQEALAGVLGTLMLEYLSGQEGRV